MYGDERVEITYEVISANGNPIIKTIVADNLSVAECECENIERAGYRIVDVTRLI